MAAEVSVTFLVQHVEAVLETHGDLISGAEEEFEQLRSDLRKLEDILKRTGHISSEDSPTEKGIREDVYEIHDTIDSWLTQVVAAKGKSQIGRSLGRLIKPRFKLAKEVKSLREDKVKPILNKAKTMRPVQEPAAGGTSAEQHLEGVKEALDKGLPLRTRNVVGFEDEERTLVDYLTQEKTRLDIISIIGTAGQGKSTLAWKIFKDNSICNDFPIRIWVSVSQAFNFRDVCLKIMKTFTGSRDISSMSDEELCQAAHACLKEEKFLLVIDEVWNTNDWDELKKVLPYDNGKGKVVITSRDIDVGRHAEQFTETHVLRFLTTDESWELLQLEVFGDLESCPPELEDIGKKIAKECGGVPLKIAVMGGILRDQFKKNKARGGLVRSEWMRISENVNHGDASQANYMNLVQLTYDGLPYDLREPFLYLGVFLPDYEIPTWKLTCLWIAEGLIQPKDYRSLEETAEENLDDLVSRNLLMVVRKNCMGQVKSCCVKDTIHTFCRVKASEQHLFQEIKMSKEKVAPHDALASKVRNIHRLCLHWNPETFFSRGVKGPRTRSFLSFHTEDIDLNPEYNSTISDSFPLLRILHVKSIRFSEFPKIVKLIHLRFIVLCVPDLEKLPESISNLWNLQTIVVDTRSHTLVVEANIWSMIWLRHFKTKATIVLDDKWEGKWGRNLQTVSRLSVSSTAAICEKASNIKTLAIRGELAKLFIDSMSLQNLIFLENLKLENDLMYGSAFENPLQRFPEQNRFPSSLRRLTLSNTYLDWKHMRTLANIGGLKALKLKRNAFSGLSWEAVDYAFNSLEYLLIADANLVLWETSTTTFPRLRCLVLKKCENLKEIPLSPSEHLQKIQVDGVRESAVESVKKIEEYLRNSKPGNQFQLSVGEVQESAGLVIVEIK